MHQQTLPSSSSSSSSSGVAGSTTHEASSFTTLTSNAPHDSHDRRSQPPSTTNSTTTSPSRPPPPPTLASVSTSHQSQPLMADLDLLISFDDDHDTSHPPKPPHPAPAAAAPSMVTHLIPSSITHRILSIHEPLVGAERDVTHFDVLPRLPLTKVHLVQQAITSRRFLLDIYIPAS